MVGNDAHYTLVAFREMCLRQPKEIKKPETKPHVPAVIRDIIPDDLKVAEKKHVPATAEKTDDKIGLAAFLNNHRGGEGTGPTQELQNPVKPPKQGKRRYFTKDPAEAATEAPLEMNPVRPDSFILHDPILARQRKSEEPAIGKQRRSTSGQRKTDNGKSSAKSTRQKREMHEDAVEQFSDTEVPPPFRVGHARLIILDRPE